MNIRPATLSDARSVAEVHVFSWQHAYCGLVPDAYLNQLSVDQREATWRQEISEKDPELWVAEKNAKILGWAAFGPSRDADATPATGEIEAIYILPAHWRQGVGRALWLAARRRLAARNFSRATLWVFAENERAIRFYRALGCLPSLCSEKVIERHGKQLTVVRYEVVID